MAYQYGHDDQDLYVEQGTDRVPDDGQFYIILRGRVIDHEATAKRALGRLQQLHANLPTDAELESGTSREARMMQAEVAASFLQQSTAEKLSQFGRKGRGR